MQEKALDVMVERRYDDGAESQSRLRSASSYLRFGNSEDCRSRSISAAPNNKEACRHACGYADIVTAVLLNRQDQKTAIESRRASTPIHSVLLGGVDHFRDDLIPRQLDSKPGKCKQCAGISHSVPFTGTHIARCSAYCLLRHTALRRALGLARTSD